MVVRCQRDAVGIPYYRSSRIVYILIVKHWDVYREGLGAGGVGIRARHRV